MKGIVVDENPLVSLTQAEYDAVMENLDAGLNSTLSQEELARWETAKMLAEEARIFCFELKFEEAKKKYWEAMNVIPGYCSLELSDLFMFEENYVDAERVWMFDRGKMKKRDWEYYWQVSEMYLRWGMWNRAAEILEEATRKFPKDEYLYSSLGKIYKNQGLYKEAEVEYRKALKLSPKSGPYCLSIAEVLVLNERVGEAINFLEEIIAEIAKEETPFWPYCYITHVKEVVVFCRRNAWRLHPFALRPRALPKER